MEFLGERHRVVVYLLLSFPRPNVGSKHFKWVGGYMSTEAVEHLSWEVTVVRYYAEVFIAYPLLQPLSSLFSEYFLSLHYHSFQSLGDCFSSIYIPPHTKVANYVLTFPKYLLQFPNNLPLFQGLRYVFVYYTPHYPLC